MNDEKDGPMQGPQSEQAPEPAERPGRKRIFHPGWESAVEKQIREAMERGDFDHLPGEGKPLDLRADPNTPAEWELAFKLLKDAGFAPDWIELDKELRGARARLFARFDTYLRRLAQGGKGAANERFEAQLVAEFREQARELNRQIDLFNLKAPTPRLYHIRIRVDEEIEKFRAVVKKSKGDLKG
ncbi:MAG: DUF1992 domain-containing protein [Anaerolineae bacterium]